MSATNTYNNRPHPWLKEFEAHPDQALNDLLRGVADMAPYERAESSDALFMLFGGPDSQNPLKPKLDSAMQGWLSSRRKERPQIRNEHGIERYVAELSQGIASIYRLKLDHSTSFLKDNFMEYQGWLSSLYLAPSRDPEGELWRLMALAQDNRRFLMDWYRICESAGETWPKHYIHTALLGLRLLPKNDGKQSGNVNKELLIGLMKWGDRLEDNRPDKQNFIRQWQTIRAMYPRTPKAWRDHMLPLMEAHTGAVFLKWLNQTGIKGNRSKANQTNRPVLPSRQQRGRLLVRIKTEPFENVLPDIQDLLERHECYTEFTGDSDFFVNTACDFGSRIVAREPSYVLELSQAANRWQPYNARTWALWARSLKELRKNRLAESVYWEMLRRFPGNVVCRNELAQLLEKTGREDEAEQLLRETMKKFPENVVCRNALAQLLEKTGREDEAEGLYREAMKKFPENDVCRNALAQLLEKTGWEDKAEKLLRETMKKFPKDAVCRTALAQLLEKTGQEDKAEELYRETMKKFPENDVCRTALGQLLEKTGREDKAEELYLETMEKFPKNIVCRHALTILLLKLNRPNEARQLYDHLKENFRENDYTRTLDEIFKKDKETEPITMGNEDDSMIQALSGDMPACENHSEETISQNGPQSQSIGYGYRALEKNRVVGQADFWLRTNNEKKRNQAWENLNDLTDQDPNDVYALLVGSLHDPERRKKNSNQIQAFPKAFSLRFMAARETGGDEQWKTLISDFPCYANYARLGKVAAHSGNGSVDSELNSLFKWASCEETEDNLNKHGKKVLKQTLFQGINDPSYPSIKPNLEKCAPELYTLIDDVLKQSVEYMAA